MRLFDSDPEDYDRKRRIIDGKETISDKIDRILCILLLFFLLGSFIATL